MHSTEEGQEKPHYCFILLTDRLNTSIFKPGTDMLGAASNLKTVSIDTEPL